METTIRAVTVFPDRARLTRVGQVTLEVGVHKIRVENLPLNLMPDSVRASGKGTARAKLLGVSVQFEQLLETPAATVQELENKLLAAQDAGAELAARQAILEKEQKNIEGLGAQSEMFVRGLVLRNQKPEEQGAIFDFVRQRLLAVQADLLKLSREKRENDKVIDQLKRQLQALGSARPKQRYVAVVEVDVVQAGELTLELTHMVTNASWHPLYDLRLTTNNLEVSYLAQVAQHTGEDWQNVALTLSTAQPAVALTVPELQPWYIAPKPPPMPAMPAAAPQVARGRMAKAAMVMDESQTFSASAPVPEAEMEYLDAVVSESGAALTYQLTAKADIPGNGDTRKVTITTLALKPELDYVTAPRLQAACFRRAKLKNESAYTFLPGQAQLFDGDDYLGATQLEFVAPQQEIELFLGADERLRVERELTQREVDKNFLGDKRRIRFAYVLKLENLRDAAQTVVVRDQLPVARDEQIKVRLESAEPRATEHDDLNRLEWKLTLAPGKRELRYEFTVEHPRTLEVLGLP
ncbi:MAG: mucoidy inhibitor MuiA family protein [Anaerolineales bacterium]|nr:mucoidy inhibitor MuiA family protein [Anaerolineales bacterium]